MRHLLPLVVLALAACGGSDPATLSPLAQDGKRVYNNVCIACHNGDPSVDGALGPAIAGASQELLHARVVEGVYPPGYEPKRPESGVTSNPSRMMRNPPPPDPKALRVTGVP